MKARSAALVAEVESEDEKMAAVVRDLGPAMVQSHGVHGAAVRIAGLYDELSVDAVALALAHQDAEPEDDGDGDAADAPGEEDEVSEGASELGKVRTRSLVTFVPTGPRLRRSSWRSSRSPTAGARCGYAFSSRA